MTTTLAQIMQHLAETSSLPLYQQLQRALREAIDKRIFAPEMVKKMHQTKGKLTDRIITSWHLYLKKMAPLGGRRGSVPNGRRFAVGHAVDDQRLFGSFARLLLSVDDLLDLGGRTNVHPHGAQIFAIVGPS